MSQEPIRILRLIARLNVGGPAIHTILLTEKMRKYGYETLLLTGREGKREGNMYHLAEEHNVKPVFIETLSRDLSPRNDLASYREICRHIQEFKPHIVHTHTAKAGALGRIAAHRCNVPVVVHTFHGHVLRGYFGKVKNQVFRQIEKRLANWTDCLVAVSNSGMDELVSMGIAPAEKFVAIPLGLDLERFRDAKKNRGKLRKELGLGEEMNLIGIVARLVPIKNHYEFFEAVRRVSSEFDDIHFVVVGDGPLWDELTTFVRKQPYADRVHFLGMREDLVNIYADLDLVVLTSKNEGLPVALIEALASGTPIIGSDVGATHELNSPFLSSGIYPPGDVDRLVGIIRGWYHRKEDYIIMQREMKDQIIERYGINRLVRDLDRLYRDLLARKGVISSS